MPLGLLFWLLMALALVVGGWVGWPRAPEQRFALAPTFLVWVLLAVLGWAVFGPALR